MIDLPGTLYPRKGVVTVIRRADIASWNCAAALDFYDEITGGVEQFVVGEWTPYHSAMIGARSPGFLRGLEKAHLIPTHPGVFRLSVENGLSKAMLRA